MSEGAVQIGDRNRSSAANGSPAAAAIGALRGVTPPTQPGGWTGFLDGVIIELGYSDRETVNWAVEQGRVQGQTVGTVLLESRIVSEDQLSRAIAELHGLQHVDLDAFDVDLDVSRLISRQAARRYKAVPIGFDSDGTLIVALADPVDPLAVSDIAVMTRSEVRPMVATESRIEAMVDQLADAPVIPAGFGGDPGGDSEAEHETTPKRDYGSMAEPSAPAPEHSFPPAETPLPPEPAMPAPEPTRAASPEPPASPQAPVAPAAAAPPSGEVPEELARARSALSDLAARLESLQPRDDELEVEGEALRKQAQSGGEERDRERTEQAKIEAEMRDKLERSKEANRRLEHRLHSVLEATVEIRAACEKLARLD